MVQVGQQSVPGQKIDSNISANDNFEHVLELLDTLVCSYVVFSTQ